MTSATHAIFDELGDPRFPAIWYRDNCCCDECRDPRSQQKLSSVTDLP